MKRQDMKRSDWKRFLKKDYTVSPCTFQGIEGVVSLSVFRELTAPLTIPYEFGEVIIADKDYSWLQLALKEQYVWLTAMYDSSGALIEMYFDITDGNHFDDKENPYFEDMYLDLVLLKSGEVRVLDREELEEAFVNKVISEAQYKRAVAECEMCHAFLTTRAKELISFCEEWQRRLRS